MAQHDYLIADQSGLSFLSDLNQLTSAIVSNNSGAVEPTDLYAYMWWADTTSGILKRRDAANNAWINFASLSTGLIIGTNVQAFDATILKDADIGVNIQAYSALLADAVTNNNIGRKNYIINGSFDIWQRGTVFNPDFTYTADRWIADNINSGGAGSVSQLVFPPGEIDVPNNPRFFLRFDQTTAFGLDTGFLRQRIEGVRTLANGNIMLSFYAKTSVPISIFVRLVQNFGIGGSSSVNTESGFINITTSWQKFEIEIALPNISGKTIGDSSFLELQFRKTAGDVFAFDIAQVQIEKGSVATDFEYRPIGEELALCQRYYLDIDSSYRFRYRNSSVALNSVITPPLTHPSPMRVTPSVTITDASSLNCSGFIVSSSSSDTQMTGFAFNEDVANETIDLRITATFDAEL